ncbi:MAG: glycosyltransferase [Candidatus Nanopelagicales bacterium]|nr:glycosyltransferase [Candidatus Nanopelagicales bacterium]
MRPFQRPLSVQELEPDAQEAHNEVSTHGNIESIRQGIVTGWAIATIRQRSVPLLEVRIVHESGATIAQGVSTRYRTDVVAAGLRTGWCGYELALIGAVPNYGSLTLQANVEGTWVMVSQTSVQQVETDAAVDGAEEGEPFADLLAVFATARTTGALIGKESLLLGTDIWIQAARDAAERARASLRLESGDDSASERAYVRIETTEGTAGRIDTRFRIRSAIPSGGAHSIVVPVRLKTQGNGSIRVNVFDAGSRRTLARYRAVTSSWITLEALLPELAPSALVEGAEPGEGLWLEVVAESVESLDIGQLSVRDNSENPFECIRVAAQSQYLVPALGDEDVLDVEPEEFTVVIPFLGNLALTKNCVDAVMANSLNLPQVILVDDGTPNGPGGHLLGGMRERVEILRFGSNRGYTAAVNAGVRAARTPKVVILNNDTRVLPGWDVPVLRALDSDEVFAAGPLSNAASYQSVPEIRSENGWAVNTLPARVRPADLAQSLRAEFGQSTFDLPILNGFCYGIKRELFDKLGGLDEVSFPRGYGEEVDIMLRSVAAGYRNVVTPGSFVYHFKSKTFAGERQELTQASNEVLRQRWGQVLPDSVSAMDESTEGATVRERFVQLLDSLTAGEDA